MDIVDKVFFEGAKVDERLAAAYKMFDSKDGELVLKDLMTFVGWGAQDPTIMEPEDAKAILASQRVLWRIKAMLNCETEKQDKGEDNE